MGLELDLYFYYKRLSFKLIFSTQNGTNIYIYIYKQYVVKTAYF